MAFEGFDDMFIEGVPLILAGNQRVRVDAVCAKWDIMGGSDVHLILDGLQV